VLRISGGDRRRSAVSTAPGAKVTYQERVGTRVLATSKSNRKGRVGQERTVKQGRVVEDAQAYADRVEATTMDNGMKGRENGGRGESEARCEGTLTGKFRGRQR
jgi:hypothetical protein